MRPELRVTDCNNRVYRTGLLPHTRWVPCVVCKWAGEIDVLLRGTRHHSADFLRNVTHREGICLLHYFRRKLFRNVDINHFASVQSPIQHPPEALRRNGPEKCKHSVTVREMHSSLAQALQFGGNCEAVGRNSTSINTVLSQTAAPHAPLNRLITTHLTPRSTDTFQQDLQAKEDTQLRPLRTIKRHYEAE